MWAVKALRLCSQLRPAVITRMSRPCHLKMPRMAASTVSSMGQGAIGVVPSASGMDNYEEAYKNFKLDVPPYFNFARDVIDKWAALEQQELDAGEELSMKHYGLWWASDVGVEYKWTYSQLSMLSKRVAYVLTGPCALEKGDRVVVMMTNFPQYWLLYLGCMRAGTVFIPVSSFHQAEEMKLRLQLSQAKCLFTDDQTIDLVEQVIGECPSVQTKVFMPSSRAMLNQLGWFNYADMYKTSKGMYMECAHTRSDDVMSIFFTSGTTGEPKLVEHTHASYGVASEITAKFWYDLAREDVFWCHCDTGWALFTWGMLAPWVQGACIFSYFGKDTSAPVILKKLEEYPVSNFCTEPIAWREYVQQDLAAYNFEALRHTTSCGELLNPEVVEKWEAKTNVPMREGYGLTETVLLVGNFRCIPPKPGSAGKPSPGYDLAIIDEEGNELKQGETGLIAVRVHPERPVGLFTRYVDNPVRTAQGYLGDFYSTGDQGYLDEDGYLWFVCRAVDIIYTEGYAVSPFTVESAMMEHGAVAECAVVSSPDHLQLTGQVVKVFVVVSESYKDVDPEDLTNMLHQHAQETLESHQVPKQIEFLPDLPATVTGKLKRASLRRKEWHPHWD